jgi:hypothetical protein
MTFGAPPIFYLVQPYSPLFDLFGPCQQFIMAFGASLMFNLVQSYSPLFDLFSPLSTIYYGIWHLTNVPPYLTLFTLI